MNYTEWLKTVPVVMTEDSLWKMEAYRLALFAAELAWHDLANNADWSELLTNAPLP